MKTVIISGWKVGFKKVEFTKLLRRDFGYSLPNAKAATDAVLNCERLELPIDGAECSRLFRKLEEVRAMYAVEDRH